MSQRKINLLMLAGAFAALVFGNPKTLSAAEEQKSVIPGTFSANVAITNEYYFRGLSQTDDAPALQGGFDFSLAYSDTDVSPNVDGKREAMLFTVARSF